MTPGVLKFIEALASTGNEWPGLAAPLAGKKSGRTSNFAATRPGLPGQDHTKRHGRGGAGFKVLASTSTSLTQQGPLVPLVIRGKENGGRTSILVICALVSGRLLPPPSRSVHPCSPLTRTPLFFCGQPTSRRPIFRCSFFCLLQGLKRNMKVCVAAVGRQSAPRSP